MTQASPAFRAIPKPEGQSLIPAAPPERRPGERLRFPAVNPSTGEPLPTYTAANAEDVAMACQAAWEAFFALSGRAASDRAALLDAAAARITALGDDLLNLASTETGLGYSRVASERDRTVNTLRLFAGE